MIDAHRDGDLLRLTLNRPDKANALLGEMMEALAEAFEARDAKVVVLTGAGRVFSAGMDLEAARTGLATSPIWERLSHAITTHPGLTIAALNGTCAGGAMGMVLACDLRIAVPSAKAFYPVMKLGFLPQPSDPARLAALIGPSRAKMILMGGQKISADQALAWGLWDELCEDPLARAQEIAADALGAEAAHIAGIKGLF